MQEAQVRYDATITAVQERFHQSLDILELEILRTKTTLRRDYEILKAKREAREKVEREEQEKQEAIERKKREAEEMEERDRERGKRVKREVETPQQTSLGTPSGVANMAGMANVGAGIATQYGQTPQASVGQQVFNAPQQPSQMYGQQGQPAGQQGQPQQPPPDQPQPQTQPPQAPMSIPQPQPQATPVDNSSGDMRLSDAPAFRNNPATQQDLSQAPPLSTDMSVNDGIDLVQEEEDNYDDLFGSGF